MARAATGNPCLKIKGPIDPSTVIDDFFIYLPCSFVFFIPLRNTQDTMRSRRRLGGGRLQGKSLSELQAIGGNTRAISATDLEILSYGQVRKTTPEQVTPPPISNYHITTRGGLRGSIPLHGGTSVTLGLAQMTRRQRVHKHNN
ncbi:hypothetical protein TNCV_987561 [Trichonephila clavipes]|nr:hypothetical protein TNCV_987561 [Trichonephila clavipes]